MFEESPVVLGKAYKPLQKMKMSDAAYSLPSWWLAYRYMIYADSLRCATADVEIKASYGKKQGGGSRAAVSKCQAQQRGGSISDPAFNTSAVQAVISLPDYLPTSWLPRLQA